MLEPIRNGKTCEHLSKRNDVERRQARTHVGIKAGALSELDETKCGAAFQVPNRENFGETLLFSRMWFWGEEEVGVLDFGASVRS